ncbi:MAG: hybrid sensor histidine kinase/response regulator [Candidatus Obscuribacterales bacterium]|nr:hybrid sensor histidine kinase/response regulator [Candidatus Obscuribacterales bacterium]
MASGNPAILLVDDQPANLMSLEEILRDPQLELVTARSGDEALKLILKREFAVVLLDVNMPGMDGFETASLIRARDKSKHLPIIFLTAMYTDDMSAARGYSLGAVDYLYKPYVPEILRSKVAVFVDLYNKTEEIRRQSIIMREMEQREYEARLLEQRQRMEAQSILMREEHRISRSILEHAPIGIARLDRTNTIIEINEEFARLFKLERSDLVRRNLFDAVPCLEEESIKQAVAENQPLFKEGLKMNGTTHASDEKHGRFFDLAVWPIKGRESLSGAVFMVLDVSERTRLSQQRDDFVATLAHDLQTPVIASDRALELLQETLQHLFSQEHRKLVSMLRDNNTTLLNMIQSLLEIYRYEAGAQPLYFDEVDLQLVAETCAREISPLAQQHGIQLRVEIPGDVQKIMADRVAVRRVIMNLMDNAIKYTPGGGEIEVFAENLDGKVRLEIADTGIGISNDALPRLFNRYWHRGDKRISERANNKQSCGLGLYLCKQIVDAHNGRIWCVSQPGKGSRFTVEFPCGVTRSLPATTHPSVAFLPAVISLADPPDGPVMMVADQEEEIRCQTKTS